MATRSRIRLVAPEESHFPVNIRHSPTSTDHRSPLGLEVNFEGPLPDSEVGGPAHGHPPYQITPSSEDEDDAAEEERAELRARAGEAGAERRQLNECRSHSMTMASSKVREPSLFSGTKDEDPSDWLAQYEMISSINGWQHRRLDFCVLYLVGEAKIWFEIREPATWAEFRTRFLSEFRRADTRDRLEAELRNRRQGLNEAVRPYFYNMLMLIKKFRKGNR